MLSITESHLLSSPSFTRCPIACPCGQVSRGENNGLTTFLHVPFKWVRPHLYTGSTTSAIPNLSIGDPGCLPFWFRPISTFGLSEITMFMVIHICWSYHLL